MAGGTDAHAFEVELKFHIPDEPALRAALTGLGFVSREEITQLDVYLNHPSRDFAQTGEAFRLRRHGSENRVTYKGRKLSSVVKTREEIELAFESGASTWEGMIRLFERLGFTAVARIEKCREVFERPGEETHVVVVIDRVAGLGTFAEVEALAVGETAVERARQQVSEVAEALGLASPEPRSYLRMVLEQGDSTGRI